MTEKCRKAGFWDYVAVVGLYVGDEAIKGAVKTEAMKPQDERNDVGIILGEICRFGLSYAKYKLNESLCDPIG